MQTEGDYVHEHETFSGTSSMPIFVFLCFHNDSHPLWMRLSIIRFSAGATARRVSHCAPGYKAIT